MSLSSRAVMRSSPNQCGQPRLFVGSRILTIRGRQVVNARLGPELFKQPEPCTTLYGLAELDGFSFGVSNSILQLVTKIDGSHSARAGAGGQLPLAEHMWTESALFDRALPMRIHVLRRVGSCQLFCGVRRFGPVEGAS